MEKATNKTNPYEFENFKIRQLSQPCCVDSFNCEYIKEKDAEVIEVIGETLVYPNKNGRVFEYKTNPDSTIMKCSIYKKDTPSLRITGTSLDFISLREAVNTFYDYMN